jgi:protein-tyrosine phosphatase
MTSSGSRPTASRRVLALPDLANARDLGGLVTGDGRRTRAGRLWRSATPYFLDADQASRLSRGLGLRLRVDLRSRGEVSGTFNPHLAQADRVVVHMPISAGGTQREIPDDHVQAMIEHYLRYLDHSRDAFRAIAEAVAEPSRLPALVHCTLGKDRTGAVVAVLLSAVGVVAEEIVDDYARTAGQNDGLLARLRELPGYRRRLDRLTAESFDAVPGVMEGFLAELGSRHGGGAGYLLEAGVAPATVTLLTESLVGDS